MQRVLIIEPYYGGSHRFFLEGLQTHVTAEYTLFTLPARKWKMRMQLSALWALEQIEGLSPKDRWFDTVLCSSFVDVAVLRALLTKVKGWNQAARLCVYFHENQFYYPERQASSRNFQFAAINFHSALAADRIAFNSFYNAETFFSGCRKYLQSASEMGLSTTMDQLRARSSILFPGIDFTDIDRMAKDLDNGPPVILWNHRWEHDKNPDIFFQVVNDLASVGIDFRLILLGKTFPNSPKCFAESKNTLGARIIHYGYVAAYADYVALLCRSQVVVSTALHEFFGIAIIEAVRAGCLPLLPERLAYPELFDKEYLYREYELSEKLAWAVVHGRRLSSETAQRMTDRFSWQNLAPRYSRWLLEYER
jgi:glycosyltransferase involved in cell wall biosynthesis